MVESSNKVVARNKNLRNLSSLAELKMGSGILELDLGFNLLE